MTRLKEIGNYSIDSSYITVGDGGSKWAYAILIVGIVIFLSSIFMSNANFGIVAALFVFGAWTLGNITEKKIPAFCLTLYLNEGSQQYYIKSENVIVTKDPEEMAKRLQVQIDNLSLIANEKIKESEEKERMQSCMKEIENKVKVMVK